MSGDIVIIGGGAIGLSVAYHLAKAGAGPVTLLERNQLTSGTSWHAAGIVGPLRATMNMTRIAMEAGAVFPELERETGQSTGYAVTGGYWLARVPERMDELRRIEAIGRHAGLTPRLLGRNELAAELPTFDLSSMHGALAVAEDANVNPVDLCMAYAKAARGRGVTIRENVSVQSILTRDGDHRTARGVQLSDGSTIAARTVVLAAGAWSRPLAESAGIALPLQPVEHMYVVTEPIDGLRQPFPVIRDLDRGLYIKGDAGKLVIGGFEPDAKCWDAQGSNGATPFLELPEDWDHFTPFMEAALALMPGLGTAGIRHFMNGPESFTVDSKPLVGPAPGIDGLFVAAGMNSVGVMSSAGIGRVLSAWITKGEPPFDLWDIDIARTDPMAAAMPHIETRMKEAVSDVFAMHWPFKMPTAGRGLRKSALHEKWAARGAVFGLTAGWERGLWYARSEAERRIPYSIGRQGWEPLAAREAQEMASGAALVDLSPFTKIDVSGPDALAILNRAVCSDVDQAEGRVRYTAFLNERAGVDGEVTIGRLGPDRFRLVSGAPTRRRDMDRLRRLSKGRNVTLADVTEAYVVIGLMGPHSREILSSLSSDDWTAFPFSTSRDVSVVGVDVLATRISFAGELGWELMIPAGEAGPVFDALAEAGAGTLGHYALEGCRIEKGYRHWGHDMGPDISVFECGLGFMVDAEKSAYRGRVAALEQKASGVRRRLLLFSLPEEPLMLHDEPIWRDGARVGLTTSGARGPRTGLNLAFGLVEAAPGESRAETLSANYVIEVAGRSYPAMPLSRAPYDPESERMKA